MPILRRNATTVLANAGNSPLSIECNTAENQTIIWTKTVNNIGNFYVSFDSRVYTTNNSRVLNFANLTLDDEEYYGCGYIQGTFVLLRSFFIYVRGIVFKRINIQINNCI